MALTDCRLRTNSPAVMRSSNDSATSATTRTFFRSNRAPRSFPVPPAPFSAGTSIGRDALNAGAMPKSTPVAHESSSAKSSTHRSIVKSKASGSAPAGGGAARNAAAIPQASAMPAIPPMTASRTLSVSSWRSRRPRLAPSASRTAISRCRAAALESSRLATFAQAISSTAPTTPPSSNAADRICCRGPANASSTRTIATRGRTTSGGAFIRVRKKSWSTGSSSAPACSIVAPGFSRAMPKIQLLVGLFSKSGFCSPEYLARGGRMIACIIIGT